MDHKKPLPTPSTATLSSIAKNLVDQEITRIIGPEGAIVCLKISAYLQLVHPLYQQYYDLVDKGEITLETIRGYFSAEAWAKIGNPQKRMLEKFIRQEVQKTRELIAVHMFQLDDNEREMRTLSPAGKEALAVVLRELTGEEAASE
jgi:hypothetical protein